MYNYVYLTGTVIPLIFWIAFFATRKDLRAEMVVIGVNVSVFGFFADNTWFLKDYWYPLKYVSAFLYFGQEFFYCFVISGVTAVAHEVVFKKKQAIAAFNRRKWFALFVVNVLAFVVLTNIFHVNSIYASIIGLSVSAAIIFYYRRDLAANALTGAVVSIGFALLGYFACLAFFPAMIEDWWRLNNISGLFIWKIPVEEIAWFLVFGVVASTSYKFCYGE